MPIASKGAVNAAYRSSPVALNAGSDTYSRDSTSAPSTATGNRTSR